MGPMAVERRGSLCCALLTMAISMAPLRAEAQYESDSAHIRFRAAYATAVRDSPSSSGKRKAILRAGEGVLLPYNAAVSGVFVRVAVPQRRDSGWVFAQALRLDSAEVDAIRPSRTRETSRGQPALPQFTLADSMMLPASACAGFPAVRRFHDDGNWILLCEFTYRHVGLAQVGFVVPRGFVTDFASVPSYARSLVLSRDEYSPAAVLHDFLYWDHRCTKDEADTFFLMAMADMGIGFKTRYLFYWVVRLAGAGAWNQNGNDKAAGLVRIVPPRYIIAPANLTWAAYRDSLLQMGVENGPYKAFPRAACHLAD